MAQAALLGETTHRYTGVLCNLCTYMLTEGGRQQVYTFQLQMCLHSNALSNQPKVLQGRQLQYNTHVYQNSAFNEIICSYK